MCDQDLHTLNSVGAYQRHMRFSGIAPERDQAHLDLRTQATLPTKAQDHGLERLVQCIDLPLTDMLPLMSASTITGSGRDCGAAKPFSLVGAPWVQLQASAMHHAFARITVAWWKRDTMSSRNLASAMRFQLPCLVFISLHSALIVRRDE